MFFRFAKWQNDSLLLTYAIVILHNRYLLSDILEKAFVAHNFIGNWRCCGDMMIAVLAEFIENGIEQTLYAEAFDGADNDPRALLFELMRAVLPAAEWFRNQYGDVVIEEVPDGLLDSLIAYSQQYGSNRKPALPKFTALSRYLYAGLVTSKTELS